MTVITFEQSSVPVGAERLHPSLLAAKDQLTIDAATADDLVLVARFQQQVVGYLAASTDLRGGLTVWEHVVASEFRSRGIGRRLLVEAARRTVPMAKLTIDPSGDFEIAAVTSYYARLGFPQVADDKFHVSAVAHEVIDAIGEQAEDDATIRAILQRKAGSIVTIKPDASVADALQKLSDQNIGSLVVSGDGVALDGVLSERDLIVAMHQRGDRAFALQVGELMTADVITANPAEIVADVMERMTVERVRHMPVTEDNSLVGIVSVGDLLVFRMREHDMRRDQLPLRSPVDREITVER